MTDESGTFIGTSENYPDKTDPRFSKQLIKMKDPVITVIRDDVDRREIQLQAFNEAVNEILTHDRYNLLNGRFNSVDTIIKYLGMHFILIVECISEKRVYIKDTYNPVEKLYRIFVSSRGRKKLIDDVDFFGRDGFSVDIISTFDNPYKEMLRLFESYDEKGYEIYNYGTYESLKMASDIVDRMGDATSSERALGGEDPESRDSREDEEKALEGL